MNVKKTFYISKIIIYCKYKQWLCVQYCFRVIEKNAVLFLGVLKLQRIDFFLKLVAASECSAEEKGLALQWVSELTDELMAKIRSHEYNRSMDVIS